jgi:hypothetical protein
MRVFAPKMHFWAQIQAGNKSLRAAVNHSGLTHNRRGNERFTMMAWPAPCPARLERGARGLRLAAPQSGPALTWGRQKRQRPSCYFQVSGSFQQWPLVNFGA